MSCLIFYTHIWCRHIILRTSFHPYVLKFLPPSWYATHGPNGYEWHHLTWFVEAIIIQQAFQCWFQLRSSLVQGPTVTKGTIWRRSPVMGGHMNYTSSVDMYVNVMFDILYSHLMQAYHHSSIRPEVLRTSLQPRSYMQRTKEHFWCYVIWSIQQDVMVTTLLSLFFGDWFNDDSIDFQRTLKLWSNIHVPPWAYERRIHRRCNG